MRWRWVNGFIGWSLSSPGTIGGAVPIYPSGSGATGWPLYHQQQQTQAAYEKDDFSRQLSVHFGSISFIIVPNSRSYADSSGCSAGGGIWTSFQSELQRVSPKVSFSQFLLPMCEITPTTSLYLLWNYPRVGDLMQFVRFIISEYPVSSAAAQWMNKDCSYYFTTSLMTHINENMYF